MQMCSDMCPDICTNMCDGMRVDMYVDMSIDICRKCLQTCRTDIRIDMLLHSSSMCRHEDACVGRQTCVCRCVYRHVCGHVYRCVAMFSSTCLPTLNDTLAFLTLSLNLVISCFVVLSFASTPECGVRNSQNDICRIENGSPTIGP